MRYLGKQFEHFSRQDRLVHYRRHAQFSHLTAPEEGKDGKIEHRAVWQVAEADSDGRAEIKVVGPIDEWFGFDPAQIIEQLDAQSDLSHIHMVISSPGGYVELAQTLYSDLRRRARQGTRITSEGLAIVASAALDLFLAGDEREASDDTLMMQHPIDGFAFFGGCKLEMEQQYSELMSQMDAYIQLNYRIMRERTGQSDAVLQEWLMQPGEMWFSVDQAFEYGLITQAPAEYESKTTDEDEEAMQQKARRLQQQVAVLIAA